MLSDLRYRWRAWRRRDAVEGELEDELRDHLDHAAAALVAAGLSPAEARRRARLELGGPEQVKERCRDSWGLAALEALGRDCRLALRSWLRNPLWTAVVILTLALGIGANSAIFAVADAVLLRPLPFPQPQELVNVVGVGPPGSGVFGASYADYVAWRDQATAFSGLAADQAHDLTLTGHGQPTTVHAAVVTPDLFATLEARPLAGRVLGPNDAGRGAAPVAMVSERLWRGYFGAEPQLIGHAIALDHRAFTVVGIMPAGFRFPPRNPPNDVWIPLAQDPLFGSWMSVRGRHYLPVEGRLRQGVSLVQAQAQLGAIMQRLAGADPADDGGFTVQLQPLRQRIVGDAAPALLLLLAAAGLVLLLACANVANLLLARAISREKEIALRLALGAGRGRVMRQALAESTLLGAAGGLAGIALCVAGVPALRALLPSSLPRLDTAQVNAGVLGFAVLISVLATLAFGLVPAIVAARGAPQAVLRESGGRSSEGRGRRRARAILAASQVALATVLLVGAGLLLRSLSALLDVNPGFATEHLIRADVSLPRYQYSTPRQWSDFARALLPRIQNTPGLRDSALGIPLPLVSQQVPMGFAIGGAPPRPRGRGPAADYVSISPSYFQVMRIPLLRGRLFTSRDAFMGPAVTMISAATARRYFPSQNPIGRHLIFGFPPGTRIDWRVVGVVGDVRAEALSEPPGPMLYVPFAQAPFWGAEVVTRTSLAPAAVASAIRADLAGVDPDLPVTDLATFPAALTSDMAGPRSRALLLGVFGAVALLLAALGIFGVISFWVSRRTQELGIRMALGAQSGTILRLIVGQGARLALLGLGVGVVLAWLLSREMGALLFGVSPADPAAFSGAVVLLFSVALAASYLPARFAIRAEPLKALRHE